MRPPNGRVWLKHRDEEIEMGRDREVGAREQGWRWI